MSAQEKIDKILATVKEGKTVYVSTAYRSYKITQKVVDSWSKLGLELFKVQGDSMMMGSGKSYVCIDYCKFTVEG